MTALILALVLQAPPADEEADLAAVREKAMKTFKVEVAFVINTYCLRCHGDKKQKAGVRFDYAVKTPGVPSFRTLWKKAAAHVEGGDMPPEDQKQPSAAERKLVLEWVANLRYLSPKDPGEFVIRRLSKVELGNTLRDLFGVDPSVVATCPTKSSARATSTPSRRCSWNAASSSPARCCRRCPPSGRRTS